MPIMLDTRFPGTGYLNSKDLDVIPFQDMVFKTGLLGAYFLSTQNENVLFNFANPALPLKAIGTPIVSKRYASCNNNNYYNTQLPSINSMTIVAAALPAEKAHGSTAGGMIVSNYKNKSDVSGDSFQMAERSVISYSAMTSDIAISSVEFGAVNIKDRDLVVGAGVFAPNHSVTGLYNPDVNGMIVKETKGLGRRVATENLLLGTNYSNNEFVGDSYPSVILIFEKDIGEQGILATCKYVRNVMGPRYDLW